MGVPKTLALLLAAVFAAVARGGLVVTFDPAGGRLDDAVRIVPEDGTYGENANLYPSDSAANFSDLPSDKITLADGVFSYATSARWCNYWTKPIASIRAGCKYTYVVDVLSYDNESASGPWFNVGFTGDDQPSQLEGRAFQVKGTGRYIQVLTGRSSDGCTTLGRDYVDFNHSDGGMCQMTFKVSLYAGDSVTERSPLPVPTREGFDFAGWTDADGQAVDETTRVGSVGDVVLRARWHRRPGVVMPVKVMFDANGGAVSERFRVVNTEQPYGRSVNLYPGDSRADFMDFADSKLSLSEGVFTYAADDRWCNYWTLRQPFVVPGDVYTYVIDVLSFERTSSNPWFNLGHTGADQPAQLSWTSVEVSGAGAYFRTLASRPESDGPFSVLGRDYIDLPSGSCRMTFRIALYPGASVSAANYSYARPGEGMPLPLPIPVCAGKVFDCWVDASGQRVTDETIVDVDDDSLTLKAQWKDWTVSVENADRPRVGVPLVLSTNYGAREDETGEVKFAWYRGDLRGEYEEMPVSGTAEYVPGTVDLEHFLKGVLLVDGREAASAELWFSRLPVAYVTTDDGADIIVKGDYRNAHLRLQGGERFAQQYDGITEIKGRGNSSWNYPKKAYKLKLDKKTDLFGFGKQKHWVLLANFIDISSLRNKTAYDMSAAFGLNALDSTWVQVVFNGRFDGLYQLCEHIRVDKTRVDIYDWEGDKAVIDETDLSPIDAATRDISGGYLWELSEEYDEVSKFTTSNGIKVMFNKPEYAFTNPAMFDWCVGFWERVTESWRSLGNVASTGESWRDLCDVDSMVSFWLVNEIFGNDDAWYKSRYCYKDIGKLLTFGPVWDFDWGCGSVAVGMANVENWRLAANNYSEYPVSFYKEWLDDPWFCLRAWEKYWELRPKFAALMSADGEMSAHVAYLAEAAHADEKRWRDARAAQFGANARGFADNASKFRTWMMTRLSWLDRQFAHVDVLISAVRNDASAQAYIRTPASLPIEIVGGEFAENEWHVRGKGRLTLSVDVPTGVDSVEMLVNGRKTVSEVGVVGRREFVLDNGAWREDNHRTLVEFIAHGSSGLLRNHVVVNPDRTSGFSLVIK